LTFNNRQQLMAGVQMFDRHRAWKQSRWAMQALPTAQGGQVPPQSTSVSDPLRMLSRQAPWTQYPFRQSLDSQSVREMQRLPVGHDPQEPPQSTSVSSPFLTPSTQEGPASVPGPLSDPFPFKPPVP
jgi:hypothetical protein